MGAAVFIGDELTAAGFRLVGVETRVPKPDAVAEALRAARQEATLVIMTAEFARQIPMQELDAALMAETPALAVISDVRMRAAAPDLARKVRRDLGVEE